MHGVNHPAPGFRAVATRTAGALSLIVVPLTYVLAVLLLGGWMHPPVAHADSGQCKWEGGPGAPTYPYCQDQDCTKDGGWLTCSDPEIRPLSDLSDAQTDGQKYVYSGGTTPLANDNAAWCAAAGGQFNGLGPLLEIHSRPIERLSNIGAALL